MSFYSPNATISSDAVGERAGRALVHPVNDLQVEDRQATGNLSHLGSLFCGKGKGGQAAEGEKIWRSTRT